VFVDHGLLRLNEAAQVMDTFAQTCRQGRTYRCVEQFYSALKGLATQRKNARSSARCSWMFFRNRQRKIKHARWLAKGTIYPDVIESARREDQEGRHHQVAPQRRRLARDACISSFSSRCGELFKDEVARARPGARLPREMVFRHPFPVPAGGAHPSAR